MTPACGRIDRAKARPDEPPPRAVETLVRAETFRYGRDGAHQEQIRCHVLHAGKIAAVQRTPWVRIRVQLGAGLLLAAIFPYLARLNFEYGRQGLQSLNYSLVATAIALTAGFYGFRQLARYPGVRASRHIVPTFAVSYGIVLTGVFLLRLDYSRLHFLASFIMCLCWFYLIYFKLQRERALQLGILPFGNWQSLCQIPDLDWVVLSDPGVPAPRLDVIVADLQADLPEAWERFIADRALEGTLIMHVKQMEETLTGRVSIEQLSENNLGSLLPGILYARVKRAGDLTICLLALPLALPIAIVAAAAIRVAGGGPVLFVQERMGFRGHVFSMYKFRTMTEHAAIDADARDQAMTLENDTRITPLGKVLRRYRIDEIPQILNILRGEMSWIGPRPEAVPLSRWYEAELPFYRYRHIVRPGITGWAQVRQGHVAAVDQVLGKLHYDFYYIKNFGFWLDLLIFAGTVRTILSGFGSR